ncbi:MAG TPA: hypothetical protein VG742_05855 [Dongiaceae bacterium]|nr:hypothetical protein [Dongiaceae bacterium]
MADGSSVSISRHDTGAHSWAMASRAPEPRLRSCVTDYVGYRESAQRPMRRLQAPFAGIPMILTFGPKIDIINGDRAAARDTHRSFLAGLHDVHVFTEYLGDQRGLQVNFTLFGAYRLLNIAMSDIANRCIDLGDLLGAEAPRLIDRLHDARDWPARFEIMD